MTPQGPDRPKGLFAEFRSQHWIVKAALVAATLLVGSPLWGLLAAAAYSIAGPLGLILGAGGLAALAIWFVGSSPSPSPSASGPPEMVDLPWFCVRCGAPVPAGESTCPECGEPAPEVPSIDIRFVAGVLNDIRDMYLAGELAEESYEDLRLLYEAQLDVLRAEPFAALAPTPEPALPPEPRPAPVAPMAATPEPTPEIVTEIEVGPEAPPEPEVPQPPPEPSVPFGELVTAWAVERQADILLYLGAFLISMAALIFVAYQGESVGPLWRVTVLTVYTVAFLVLGILLHRWEQAREAGPIFLALGAILVPIDLAAMLRVEAFEEQGIPSDVLWLLGSSACAVLYSLLAIRGYGRFYYIPTVPAVLVAWGALGAVINLPAEWFGAWFEMVAASLYVLAARGEIPAASWVRVGAATLGAGALLYAGGGAFSEDHHWQLPVAFAVALTAPSGALAFRRSVPDLAAIPLLAAATAITAHWVALDPDPAWYWPYIAGSGVLYILAARFDERIQGVVARGRVRPLEPCRARRARGTRSPKGHRLRCPLRFWSRQLARPLASHSGGQSGAPVGPRCLPWWPPRQARPRGHGSISRLNGRRSGRLWPPSATCCQPNLMDDSGPHGKSWRWSSEPRRPRGRRRSPSSRNPVQARSSS